MQQKTPGLQVRRAHALCFYMLTDRVPADTQFEICWRENRNRSTVRTVPASLSFSFRAEILYKSFSPKGDYGRFEQRGRHGRGHCFACVSLPAEGSHLDLPGQFVAECTA
jgi:hypothetical protein